MNRARWITSIVTLSALWLMGALVLAPRMQNALETAAHEAVEGLPGFKARASRVKLVFQGQQAHLSGAVRTPQDRSTLEQAVSELVRAPTPLAASLGLRLNPVSAVYNDIEVAPLPPGWLLLAATGTQARLLGAAASEHEARDLARSVQENWGTRGGVVRGVPLIDAEYRDEAASVSTTLRGLPPPQNSAQTLLARIGQPWKTFRPDEPDAALLAEARLQGVTEAEWQEQVLPVLQEVRASARAQQAAEIERHRQAALPRGHVFIATRGGEITLRGEVGDAAAKRGLLDETLPVFAPRQVHDEIRISPRRRPGGEFAAISSALLPEKGAGQEKTLYLGFEGGAWKPVDWQVAGEAQPWKKELPADVDAALIQQDSNELIAWLQGAAKPRATVPARPAFITLAVFGGKAVLCGQVGEESTRSQVIAAARRAYVPRILVLHDELLLDAGCLPARGILNTVKSLPPAPTAASEGIFAIATPGGAWTVLSVNRDLVEAGGLARAKGLPDGLSASMVEERSIEAIEQLRHWIFPPPPAYLHALMSSFLWLLLYLAPLLGLTAVIFAWLGWKWRGTDLCKIIQELQTRIDDINAARSAGEVEHDTLRGQIRTAENELSASRDGLQAAQEAKRLSLDAAVKAQEFSLSLKSELARTIHELEALRTERDHVSAALAAAHAEIEHQRTRPEPANDVKVASETEPAPVEKPKRKRPGTVSTQKAANAAPRSVGLQSTLAALEIRLAAQEPTLTTLTQERDDWQHRVTKMESQTTADPAGLGLAYRSLADSEERLQSAAQEIERLKKQASVLQRVTENAAALADTPDDDLTRIKGIKNVISEQLRAHGIRTWRQIAQWNDDELRAFSEILAFKNRASREQWQQQARALHEAAHGPLS